MSKIVVCYKWVVDEADIRIDVSSVDTTKARRKISDYDRNAIEAGVQAASSVNGKAVGLTFGTSAARQSIKDALSRGLEEGFYVNAEEAATADGTVTAKALAAAVNKINDVKMVICAEGASDTFARQTAPRIGAILDWPVITSVCKMEFSGNKLTAVRKMDDCQETVTAELPLVVAVLPEINAAPIPGLRAVMAAGKKTVTEFKSEELKIDFAPKARITGLKGYVMSRKNIVFDEGDAGEKVSQLVTALKKEGVL